MTMKCENRISRNAEIAQQEMLKSHTNDTDLSNTEYIDTENNDMNDLNDIELKKYEYLCLIYIYLSFLKIVWL